MTDLSYFQRDQIVGVHLASVTETFQLLGVSRGSVSKVMIAYTQLDKTSSAKQNREQKERLIERDRKNIYGRAAIPKPLVTDVNAKRRLQWRHTHKTWSIDKWKKVIWPDESSLMLFHTIKRVNVCRTPAQVYHRDCLLLTVKHKGLSVGQPCQGDGILQGDNSPIHAAGLVQSEFDEHEDKVKHLP
ncbi:DDE_3 domain-containing protein [Trichonephila clavipes]|nr:DDE_3 domain-containing protein [Trichonephila clavipes]